MKTTTVTFSGLRTTTSDPLYQYDYGQGLVFADLDLPEAYEVHFSNMSMKGESTSQIGDENGVSIPDMYFLSGEDIFAWIYLHEGEDDGETVYKVTIPIKKRAQPTGIQPTPVQQDVITQAIAKMDEIISEYEDLVDDTLSIEGKAADAKATGDAIAASAVTIDDTLTQQGQAADAKATGDAITGLVDSTLAISGKAADSKKTGDEITDLKEALTSAEATLTHKADKDGSYEDLTAGNAKQLESTQYVENSEPYLFRTSGGSSDIGNREYVDAIVGGSVVWNQLAKIDMVKSGTNAGLTFSADGDGYVTLTGTATDIFSVALGTTVSDIVSGHVYYPVFGDIIEPGQAIMLMTNGWAQYFIPGRVKKSTADVESGSSVQVRISTGKTIDGKFPIMLFDLTQMFGSTIADYIYSLEQATAGAGVAWFRKLFPKNYYAYDAGTLKSVEGLTAHEMVGFNQWDEEWELGVYDLATGAKVANTTNIRNKNLIPVLPNTRYCWNNSVSNVVRWVFFDADKNRLSSMSTTATSPYEFTTPENAHYMAFYYGATTYNGTLCINLSWSGTRNGEYQPYEKHSYPLDDSLTLRGIPKLNSNNELYYDGDRYLPDGTVERRYGVVDLGSLTWSVESDQYNIFKAVVTGMKNPTVRNDPGILSARYGLSESPTINNNMTNKSMMRNTSGSLLLVRDDTYSDAASIKASLSGVMLVYELSTPVTETADPYQEVQICNDWGTEEYVLSDTAFPVPVGHETRYPANLRDKLQHLPDLADDDGYYAIKQVGTQMSLERFRIPKAPETDGTYTLKATVTSGTPTYTWVDESQG